MELELGRLAWRSGVLLEVEPIISTGTHSFWPELTSTGFCLRYKIETPQDIWDSSEFEPTACALLQWPLVHWRGRRVAQYQRRF